MFSFGLGSGCDEFLVTNVARSGRGTYTFVKDGASDLNAKVIRALSNAMEPSLKNAKWGWNNDLNKEEELYRNKLVHSTILLDASAFEEIKFEFHAK